jgi:hypothetical protein
MPRNGMAIPTAISTSGAGITNSPAGATTRAAKPLQRHV